MFLMIAKMGAILSWGACSVSWVSGISNLFLSSMVSLVRGGGGLTSRLSLMNPSVPGVIGGCFWFSVTGFILSWGPCLSLVPDVEGLSVSGRSFASLGSRLYFTISQGRWGMTGPECSSCVPGFEPGAEPIGSRMGV